MGSLQYQAGLVGKVPAQADFLRINAATPRAHALHRWLEDGNEALARGALQLPARPIELALLAPDGLWVGVLAQGKDRVGRTFPTIVFAAGGVPVELALVFDVFAPFLQAASELLTRVEGMDVAEVTRSIGLLPLPFEEQLPRAKEEHHRGLTAAGVGALQALFEGQGAKASHCYGLRTFLSACDAEKKNEPGRNGLALDCPISETLGIEPALWADLFARRCGRASTVSLLWTDTRLLLGFGPLSAGWLTFLAKADHPSMKRWPLVTAQATAVEAAKGALPPALRSTLEQPERTLEELLTAAVR